MANPARKKRLQAAKKRRNNRVRTLQHQLAAAETLMGGRAALARHAAAVTSPAKPTMAARPSAVSSKWQARNRGLWAAMNEAAQRAGARTVAWLRRWRQDVYNRAAQVGYLLS